MPEQDIQEDKSAGGGGGEKAFLIKHWKKITLISASLIVGVALIWVIVYLIRKRAEIAWFSGPMIALYIAVGIIIAVVAAWLILRKTLRTRLRMEKVVRDDPDINDWLVIYNWTPKVLYVPTIAISFIAAILSCIRGIPPAAIGGIWFVVFFLNFIIEEYNVSIKILIITLVGLGFFLLWLHLLGKVVDFFRFFRHVAISMNATVYLLVGVVGSATVFISWLKGLFYYITITPNYMNIQDGPTESGEQIGREDYNSRIDTSDFLERLMGFGRIIITFKDRKREPIIVLVWRIQKKAQLLESVRAKFAIDHLQRIQPSQP
ncbi:MAG: hypothetical protein JW715_08995 [Sedimentisphaerales bacterium]|nr:hypothetical protein [Sedimentisphaerales bacterium]